MQQFFRFSSTQFYHSVDASSGAFHNILRKEDFFSASSFETVIDVHKSCYLHIHAGELYGNRVEFFIRTGKLEMFYDTVFCSDDKFFMFGFFCK